MKITLTHHNAYAFTGGKEIDLTKPSVMFVHGASLDHTVWTLPARHFARHGRNVLAVDLPGHGLSEGSYLPEISQYADWLVEVLDALDISKTALVGHSMGSLVTLECAARHPDRIRALAMVGTSVPMPVTEQLLNAACNDPYSAMELLTAWGHSTDAHFGGNETPGMWMIGGLLRLFERGRPGALFNDLNACNNYKNGLTAASNVKCPALLILGEHDQLTPARFAKQLAVQIENSRTVLLDRTGHTIMSEKPDALLDALIQIV